jgi:hypothetical protein
MQNRITLITPPDIFENESYSIMFIHLTDQDQEKVSIWLANNPIKEHLNIYFYSGETNVDCMLHALARCDYKFIDLDNMNNITSALSGYILGKKNTFFKTTDENLSSIYSYINQNKITNVEVFLTKALNDKAN